MTTVTIDTISDTFNRSDSPTLGPGWGPRMGPDHPVNSQIVGNQAQFSASGTGKLQEDNRAPVPNVLYPDVTIAAVVTDMTRTGAGSYNNVVGLGARIREVRRDLPFDAFDANTLELFKTTDFGGELYVISLNKYSAYPVGGQPVTLASDNEPVASITLPGTLTLAIDNGAATGTFVPSVGPTLTCTTSAHGALHPWGTVNLGLGSRCVVGDSGLVRVDSFTVTQTIPTATEDVMLTKLLARYPTGDKNVGSLLVRYRQDQALPTWESYVAHVAGASPSINFADDEKAFWDAFVP